MDQLTLRFGVRRSGTVYWRWAVDSGGWSRENSRDLTDIAESMVKLN